MVRHTWDLSSTIRPPSTSFIFFFFYLPSKFPIPPYAFPLLLIRVHHGAHRHRSQGPASAVIDFNGHLAAADRQLQTRLGRVQAAVLYVFRTLGEDEIHMNEGCLKPLEIVFRRTAC